MNEKYMPMAVFIVIGMLLPISISVPNVEEHGTLHIINDPTIEPEISMEAEDLLAGSLQFTMNNGQINREDVFFYTSGGPITTGFMKNGLTVAVSGEEKGYSYNIEFVNGRSPGPTGEELLSHRSNFFIGSDPEEWRTDVNNFAELVYFNVWPNIDIVYRTLDGNLKYDIIVGSGGSIEDIKFRFEGAEPSIIDNVLKIPTPEGIVVDDPPVTYQGDNEIPSSWENAGKGIVGFQIGTYDPSEELVIDPGFRYSSYVGGSSHDRGRDLAVDSQGYLYLTGYTASNNFPTTVGAYDTGFNGGSNGDAFVVKVNVSGDRLIYSTFLGGSGNDYGFGIDVDSSGRAYAVGQTFSNNFPTQNSFDNAYSRNGEGFVTRLSSQGNSISYSGYLGGYSTDAAHDVFVDASNIAYITGEAGWYNFNWGAQWSFPTTSGAYDRWHNGAGFSSDKDAFITKVSSNGGSLVYSTIIGSSNNDIGFGIDVDSSGYAYITGGTESSNFPTTVGAYNRTHGGNEEIFVLKMSVSGNSLSYSTFIGGSGSDRADEIELDSSNRAYITGQTTSSNYPTTANAYDTTFGGNSDAFISLLSTNGANMINSTFLGGSGDDIGAGIVLGPNGRAYVTGLTSSTNFPTTTDALSRTKIGGTDIFVSKMDIGGTGMEYSTYIGGSNNDEARDIYVDSVGFIYLSGQTNSNNFPTTFVSFDRVHNSNDDVFYTKFYPADFSPTGLTSTSGYFFVNLTWNAPTTPIVSTYGIAGYMVYRGLDQNTLTPIAMLGTTTHYNDTINSFTSRSYYYFVTAILNTIGESGESNMISSAPMVTPDPVDPVPIEGDMFVNLTWSMLDQVYMDLFEIDYVIYRGITPSFLTEISNVGEMGYFNDTDVPPKPITYFYQVSYSIKNIGDSNLTNIIPATPRTPPGIPDSISLDPMDRMMNLSWREPLINGGHPINSYTVYRGPTPELLSPVLSSPGAPTPYFDADIIPGSTYYYSVTAANRLGESTLPIPVKGTGQTIPSPPRDIRLLPEDQRITIEWQPPEFDWGTEITGYSIYKGSSEDLLTISKIVDGYTRSFTDTVSNGYPFYYSVTATNIHGESPQTEPLMSIATGIPNVVTNITADIGDGSVLLKWEGAPFDGGLPIISYKVYRGLGLDDLDSVFTLSSGARTFRDTGLENGVTYYYRVTATNMNGESALSVAVIATPGRIPDRITQINVQGGLENSVLSWTNPTDLGGREGLNILIYKGSSPSSLAPYEMISYGEEGHKDEGLIPGHVYYYGLTVINNIGEGPMSPVVSTIVYGKPSAPTITDFETSSRSINLSWIPPEYDGGLPIITYRVDIRPEGELEWEKLYTKQLYHKFIGLSQGSSYDMRVAAGNELSEGNPSKIIKALVGDPPEAPRDLKVDLIRPEVRVSWNARPQISLPVIGYRVYMKIEDNDPIFWEDVEQDVKQVIVEGLIKGVNYSFAVSAYNIIGESKLTPFKIIDPTSKPGNIPWIWIDSIGDEFVKIMWTPPNFMGGTKITSYTLYRGATPASDDLLVSGLINLGFLDEDVINGRTYYYKVKAFNKEGGSEYSASIMARPIGTPSIPVGFESDPSTDKVEFSWSPPENTGGDPITGYVLYKGRNEEDLQLYAEFDPNTTSFTDRDVSDGSYIYRLTAVNPYGEGKAAEIEVTIPPRMLIGIMVGGAGLFIPILIILLILFLPGYLKKRQEKKEKKRKEAEEEELRLRQMRAEGLASRGLPGLSGRAPALNGGTHRPGIGAPATTRNLPPPSEPTPPPVDSGYIRPKEKKAAKKDKKKILRADGKSLEHRMKEEEMRHSLTSKDHHKGKHWEEEKNKALEEEAKKVFTGQQIHETEPESTPAPGPSPPEEHHEEEADEGVVPTVEDVLKDMPVMGDEEADKDVPTWSEGEEESIPTWGEEEIPMAEMPKVEAPDQDVSIADDFEEVEDLDELEEYDDLEEYEE